MLAILKPTVWLMQRMKYPYKFALLGALGLCQVMYLAHPLLTEYRNTIHFARSEHMALTLDSALLSVIQALQQRRFLAYMQADPMRGAQLSAALFHGGEQDVQQAMDSVDAVMARYGDALRASTRWALVKDRWKDLQQDAPGMGSAARFRAYSDLIKDVHDLIDHVGETGRLLLDPEAPSYFLMEAGTLLLPDTLEMLGQLRSAGSQAWLSEQVSEDGRLQLAGRVALLRANLHQVETAFAQVARTNPDIADQVEEFGSRFHDGVEALLAIVQSDVIEGKKTTSPEHYVELSTATIDLGFVKVNEVFLPALDRLLAQRIEKAEKKMWFDVSLMLMFFLLFLYLSVGAFFSMSDSVKRLKAGADRVSKGDFMTPIRLESRDELSGVSASFNTMAAQLEARTRELAKVDAASRSKSLFLASVSHELRTPLNSVLGHAQLMAMDEGLSGEARSQAGEIKQAGEHLLALVNDLIDLSRIESGQMEMRVEPLDARQVSSSAMSLVRSMAAKFGVALTGQCVVNDNEQAPLILADFARLRQALVNLLSNAIKYNRPEGSVMISGELSDRSFRFLVTDTGHGISEAMQPRLFTAFDRLGRETGAIEGSGIGLVITKRITEAMGGRLGFSSVEGVGSTFWLEFPLAKFVKSEPDPVA